MKFDLRTDRGLFPHMQHVLLKSKIHRACVTVADVEYEGSIEIPSDLMEAAGLWEGERVLVTSASKGGRLETYAQAGEPGTGKIIMNGGAAHIIKAGERITIMAFAISENPILPKKVVCDENNVIIRHIK
ncbi:aspartate 1-decarboxylase [Oceaniferula flava]|nr:aspartate 1-decarboxylase [Oceaniferula flavus]